MIDMHDSLSLKDYFLLMGLINLYTRSKISPIVFSTAAIVPIHALELLSLHKTGGLNLKDTLFIIGGTIFPLVAAKLLEKIGMSFIVSQLSMGLRTIIDVISLLLMVDKAGFLSTKNAIAYMFAPINIGHLLIHFCRLYQAGMATPENMAVIIDYPCPYSRNMVVNILMALNQEGILLTPEYRAAVCENFRGNLVSSALIILHRKRILNPENFKLIAKFSRRKLLIMQYLDKVNILNQENFMFIAAADIDLLQIKHLHKISMLTSENLRLIANPDKIKRLAIRGSYSAILNQSAFPATLVPNEILIMSSKYENYQRIRLLLPDAFGKSILPLEQFAQIRLEQLKASEDLDIFSLSKTKLPSCCIQRIQFYEGRLHLLIQQLPLPFALDELEHYTDNLRKAIELFKQKIYIDNVIVKLHKVIVKAEATMLKAKHSVFPIEQLDEKQARIEAMKQLTRWLGDDVQALSVEEIALLASQGSVRLILDDNPLHLEKLSGLKAELIEAQEQCDLSPQLSLQ